MPTKKTPKKDRILSSANSWAVWRNISGLEDARRSHMEALADMGHCTAHVAAWHADQQRMASNWGTQARDAVIHLTGGTF